MTLKMMVKVLWIITLHVDLNLNSVIRQHPNSVLIIKYVLFLCVFVNPIHHSTLVFIVLLLQLIVFYRHCFYYISSFINYSMELHMVSVPAKS